MKILLDSCSLILLAKASVLEIAICNYNIQTTTAALEEVLKGKEKMFEDALLVDRLHKEGVLISIDTDKNLTNKLMGDFNMGEGEASIIAHGILERDIVGTDNNQGRKAAKVNNLQVVGSIELIVSLRKKCEITRQKAMSALDALSKHGWFDGYLIDKAKEDIS